MSDQNVYPCVTLIDMLKIPEDRREAFAAELPDLLKSLDDYVAKLRKKNKKITDSQLVHMIRKTQWVDDIDRKINFSTTKTKPDGTTELNAHTVDMDDL